MNRLYKLTIFTDLLNVMTDCTYQLSLLTMIILFCFLTVLTVKEKQYDIRWRQSDKPTLSNIEGLSQLKILRVCTC